MEVGKTSSVHPRHCTPLVAWKGRRPPPSVRLENIEGRFCRGMVRSGDNRLAPGFFKRFYSPG